MDMEDREYTPRELDEIATEMLRADVRSGNSIKGPNPILFEEHLRNRYRREIYNREGTPDPGIVSGIYNRCVDDQTKALTPSGWKSYSELLVDIDKIWAYSPVTDTCAWETLDGIHVSQYDGMLDVLESQNISARTTPGHKWVVVHESDKTLRVERHDGLNLRDYIILCRPPKEVEEEGYDPLFELAGWVISDGTYREGNKMTVTQALHNPKCIQLRECLSALGLPIEPRSVDVNNVGTWYVKAEVGKLIREIASVKTVSAIDLSKFSHGQYTSLLRGIILGDGSLIPSKKTPGVIHRVVFTTKETEADAIQALCSVLGLTTSIRRIDNPAAFCPLEFSIYIKKRGGNFAYVRPALKEQVAYQGDVWCPTVYSGFWLAQRNGKVYVTGNTHPEGRKVNSAEQRKRNGASYYR